MRTSLITGIILGLLLMSTQLGANEGPERILLATGFEPFAGIPTNGSWEALKNLNGEQITGTKIITAQLPVVWDKAANTLQELIKTYHPIAVVSFGQAGAEPVRLETTAHNLREQTPDNAGIKPNNLAVYPEAPREIATALPLRAIENDLRAAGIPATISHDAGTYLCNDTFYALMFRPGTDEAKAIPRGFIHVPPLNAKVRTEDGQIVVFDQALLQKTAETVIQSVIDNLPMAH